jgi:hypothetical protein
MSGPTFEKNLHKGHHPKRTAGRHMDSAESMNRLLYKVAFYVGCIYILWQPAYPLSCKTEKGDSIIIVPKGNIAWRASSCPRLTFPHLASVDIYNL